MHKYHCRDTENIKQDSIMLSKEQNYVLVTDSKEKEVDKLPDK